MLIRFFNTFEPVSPTYRDLLPFLAEQGVQVEVLVTSKEYRQGRGRLEEALDHRNICLKRIWAGRGLARSRWQKLWVMLTYALGAAVFSLFGRRADLNLFLTQPPLYTLWGYFLSVVRRQPYGCLIMDIYPDVGVQDGLFKEDALFTRLARAASAFATRHAEAVLVIGRCMADRVRDMGVPAERIHLIPNWVNENAVYPVSREENSLQRELGLQEAFVVLYSGNLGTSHYFDDLVQVARRCRAIGDLRFVFIGDGIRRREVEAAKAQHGLSNVLMVDYQPAHRLAQSLSMGDLHFVCLRDGFEGLVVPSKAYGTLAAGRPTLYQGGRSGEIARMVEEEGVGTVVPLRDPASLEQAIMRYYHNPMLVADEGRRALSLAQGRYSRQRALQAYKSVLLDGWADLHPEGAFSGT